MGTDRLRASRAIEQKKREMGDEAKEGLLVRMLALRIAIDFLHSTSVYCLTNIKAG